PVSLHRSTAARARRTMPGFMQALTTGSLTRHLLTTTTLMPVHVVFQKLSFLLYLYWGGRLGQEAGAGVGISRSRRVLILAVCQLLGGGITTLVSHATGQKDAARARFVFNQSQILSVVVGVLFLIVGMIVRIPYVNALGADARTATLASDYLLWYVPAMALQ